MKTRKPVNIITRNSDGGLQYTPYSLTAMCQVILSDAAYDIDNRPSAVDFIAGIS